jgi:hypothetical protein
LLLSGGVDNAPFLLLSACPPGAAVLVSIPWGMAGGVGSSALVPLTPAGVLKSGFAVGGTPTSALAAGGTGFAVPTTGGFTGPPPPANANAGLSRMDADNTVIAMVRMAASPIRIEQRQSPLSD